jgi:hypothetical protein
MAYLGNNFSQQSYSPATDFFSGNGVTTTFTLTRPLQSVYGIEVVVNNVQQNPSSTYTINASGQIVFVAAPSAGTNNIYVNYNAPIAQITGVGQGTVGSQQLGSVSNINSVASNMTLQTNGATAVTVDQNQNVVVGTGAPALYSKATVYFSGLYETTTKRYLDISGDFAGTNAAAATNAGATTGIRMGYPALPGKYSIIGAVSEDNLGYARTNGLTFQTSVQDTAPVERMRISGAGYVTTPFQPSFNISKGNDNVPAANTAIIFAGTYQHNVGNNYSTSTGRFTAPVAGRYLFTFNGVNHAISNYMYCWLVINGTQVPGAYTHLPQTVGEYSFLNFSVVVNLAVNDWVAVYQGYNGGTPYFEGSRSGFSGMLLG